MQERLEGLLMYLSQALDDCKDFTVVAQKEDSGSDDRFRPGDIPVVEVLSESSDEEVCIIRGSGANESPAPLKLKSLYEALQSELRANPGYSLMVSEWFKLDGGFKARLDMPISGVEIDTGKEVIRLLF